MQGASNSAGTTRSPRLGGRGRRACPAMPADGRPGGKGVTPGALMPAAPSTAPGIPYTAAGIPDGRAGGPVRVIDGDLEVHDL